MASTLSSIHHLPPIIADELRSCWLWSLPIVLGHCRSVEVIVDVNQADAGAVAGADDSGVDALAYESGRPQRALGEGGGGCAGKFCDCVCAYFHRFSSVCFFLVLRAPLMAAIRCRRPDYSGGVSSKNSVPGRIFMVSIFRFHFKSKL